ncbi:MAG TPA: hypothetical protein VGJ93_07330 [Desulfuromonadaceae bacterium]|jgi:hypothetical protein
MTENKWIIRIVALLFYGLVVGTVGSLSEAKFSKTTKTEVFASKDYEQVVTLIREKKLDPRKIKTAYVNEHGFAEFYFGSILTLLFLSAPYVLLKWIISRILRQRTGRSNKGLVTDAATDAAPHIP